jgi:hypothetical protein
LENLLYQLLEKTIIIIFCDTSVPKFKSFILMTIEVLLIFDNLPTCRDNYFISYNNNEYIFLSQKKNRPSSTWNESQRRTNLWKPICEDFEWMMNATRKIHIDKQTNMVEITSWGPTLSNSTVHILQRHLLQILPHIKLIMDIFHLSLQFFTTTTPHQSSYP